MESARFCSVDACRVAYIEYFGDGTGGSADETAGDTYDRVVVSTTSFRLPMMNGPVVSISGLVGRSNTVFVLKPYFGFKWSSLDSDDWAPRHSRARETSEPA